MQDREPPPWITQQAPDGQACGQEMLPLPSQMLDSLETAPNSHTELARTHPVPYPCLQGRRLRPKERSQTIQVGYLAPCEVLYRHPSLVW